MPQADRRDSAEHFNSNMPQGQSKPPAHGEKYVRKCSTARDHQPDIPAAPHIGHSRHHLKEVSMRKLSWLLTPFMVLALGMGGTALARDFVIGVESIAETLDPHDSMAGQGFDYRGHVYDSIVWLDGTGNPQPGLVTEWKAVDPNTWELTVRPDVKFHNGSPLTADDIAFSLWRTCNVPGTDNPMAIVGNLVSERIVVSPTKLILKTAAPQPILMRYLGIVPVVSRAVGEKHMQVNDYNTGVASIGTGPYKLKEFVTGQRIVLERNDDYWGKKPAWETVTLLNIEKPESRVSALLAGDVDLINNVPADQLASLDNNSDVRVWRAKSSLFRFLIMDQFTDSPSDMTDNDGKPMTRNPFKDQRVRRAISLAINREALIETALEGLGIPAGQLLDEGFSGVDPTLKPDAYDPKEARRLLAEAGYPDGFRVVLHGSSGHYYNAPQVVETIGQMLARVGIKTSIEIHPRAEYSRAGRRFEYSFALFGWGVYVGETSETIMALLMTNAPETGTGFANRGRYSNPAVDQAAREALAEFDPVKRDKLLARTVRIAMEDYGVMPLYFGMGVWASRADVNFDARADSRTLAILAAPADAGR